MTKLNPELKELLWLKDNIGIDDDSFNRFIQKEKQISYKLDKLQEYEDLELKYEELRKVQSDENLKLRQENQTLKSSLEELLKQSPSIDFIRKDNVKELLEKVK